MNSCVRNQSFTSEWFPVRQGTRQGGKSSPLLFLLYINGLIQELENSKLGFCIYNFNICSPTVADDMILFSMSKYGLDQMLQICYEYSLKWRFEYNAKKCSVVVYNETKHEFDQSDRSWKLGDQTITEDIQYTHLGIICNKYCSLNDNIHSASIKLRGTLLNISNSGVGSGNLNIFSLTKLYRTVVLPTSLYGCELWSYLTSANILEIERAHRFCIKYIQRLPLFTNNQASLSCLGLVPIETEINYKKLQFLGQLVRLPCQYLSKRIFINRLVRYKSCIERQSLGFIPDVLGLLRKYDLMHYVDIFLETAYFPSKYQWKYILKRNVYGIDSEEGTISACSSLPTGIGKTIFQKQEPCTIWQLSRKFPSVKMYCFTAIYVLCRLLSFSRPELCTQCDKCVVNLVVHKLLLCTSQDKLRKCLWQNISCVTGIKTYIDFIKQPPETQIYDMLAGLETHELPDTASETLMIICFRAFWQMLQT